MAESTDYEDQIRERLIDTLLATDLIQGYDWLGTDTSYPTEQEIRSEIGALADEILADFPELKRQHAEAH